MSETLVCPVCGDDVDAFGCMGELRGKHTRIELERLREKLAKVRAWRRGTLESPAITSPDWRTLDAILDEP